MAPDQGGDKKANEKRRAGGALRVPFVRRCASSTFGGAKSTAFIVNINVLGAYVAIDDDAGPRRSPSAAASRCPRASTSAGRSGVVAWTNPSQPHPVHSLPPGFGVGFRNLSTDPRADRVRSSTDYVARQGRG